MSDLSMREAKRRLKKQLAFQLRENASPPQGTSLTSSAAAGFKTSSQVRIPIIPPTTFLLEDFKAEEWVQVVRKKRRDMAVSRFISR